MMRGLLAFVLLPFATLPAQAAYIAPSLETVQPATAFAAPFEGEEEGVPGFVVLARDTLFGEAERRVETCRAFAQAGQEGFTDITQNATPFYDDWLWVRCTALDYLQQVIDVTDVPPAPLPAAIVERLPALVSERSACADKVAAVTAALRDETWLAFEGARKGQETPTHWREQPPAQFELIAGSDKESTVLAVSPATDDAIRLHLNGATGAVERLAQFDRDGDGIDDLLLYLSWESPVFGAYRREVMWLKGGEEVAPYTLFAPKSALGDVMDQCPDHLSEVIAGPADLQK